MPNVKRTPLKMTSDAGRRPVRPIDREKMRPWLERHLNNNTAPGVRWVDRAKDVFEIPWLHAARHGWKLERDACIFEQWAIHTKKYIEGKDKEKDPKRWKANFRCALNSLPDVVRVTGPLSKGSNAVRRYRFLAEEESKAKQTKARRYRRRVKEEEEEEEEREAEEVTCIDYGNTEDNDTVPSPRANCSIPNFDQLLSASDVVSGRAHSSTSHMSGCHVLQRSCATPPSPQPRSLSPNSVESASDSEVSHYSDEESTVEQIEIDLWRIESESGSSLGDYHPHLWTEMMDFHDESTLAQQVELETTEIEVNSIANLTPRPEYWELTSNIQE